MMKLIYSHAGSTSVTTQLSAVARHLARTAQLRPAGEPGVGRTAVVEQLAYRVIEDGVPSALHGVRLIELNMTSLESGTPYRGDFEDRITEILAEAEHHKMVLVIDELHTLIGAGGRCGHDAGQALRPARARGTVRVIGATTDDEWREIERDGALALRFSKIFVTLADAVLAGELPHEGKTVQAALDRHAHVVCTSR